jgi:hypothetical protein
MLTKANMHALAKLLLERFGGKVGRGLALRLSRRRDLSGRLESLFAPVLTSLTVEDESPAEMGDNERMQTNVCGRAKGASVLPCHKASGPGPSQWT